MITATLLGRLQTKALTYPILALVTLIFAYFGGSAYLWLFAITMLVGIILEAVWGLVISYQPGWLSFVLGAIEFLAVANIAIAFAVPITIGAAAVYYITAWIIIQLLLIYLLPVCRTCWGEYGGELW